MPCACDDCDARTAGASTAANAAIAASIRVIQFLCFGVFSILRFLRGHLQLWAVGQSDFYRELRGNDKLKKLRARMPVWA